MDSRLHDLSKIARHEQSAMHQNQLEQRSHGADSDTGTQTALPPTLAMPDHGLHHLLQSMAGIRPDGGSSGAPDAATRSPSPTFLDPTYGWGLYAVNENTTLARSAEQEGIALIAKSILDRFEELSGGESEQERSDVDEHEVPEPIVTREYMM